MIVKNCLAPLSPSNPERERNQMGRYVVISGVVVSEFRIKLRVTLAQVYCQASADILAKGVGTSASRDKIRGADSAAVPPGPIRITNHAHPRPRRLAGAMIPADSSNYVASHWVPLSKADNWIERHGILACAGAWRLQEIFGLGVDRQGVPHKFGVKAYNS